MIDASADMLIRRATADDQAAIFELAARALGWAGDDRDRDYFHWKHAGNAFGSSPMWVAVGGDGLLGFRAFLRWELRRGPHLMRMVRAVDTATAPEAQGKGVFTALTTRAVDDLRAEGVDAVFNTPNDKSRPGYLKMGWVQLGRPTLRVRPDSVRSLIGMARSRTAAEKWSLPTEVGLSIDDALSSGLVVPPADGGWHTPIGPDYLRWRFGFPPLHYRFAEVPGGHCGFRLRRRGAAVELAVVAWLSERPARGTLGRLVRQAGADYAVGFGNALRSGTLPIPAQGPIVTWRSVASAAVVPLADLSFELGDLELF